MRAPILLLLPLTLGSAASAAPQGREPLDVVTTLNLLADLAREVGGELVRVESLSDPREDPHYVQPRPTLMKRARDADLFVELGLQLEPWVQKVIEGSGNPRIQTGQPGRVVASRGLRTLELPQQLSREWGDVHPSGNPHVWLDPLNLPDLAENVVEGLARVDPTNEPAYRARLEAFRRSIEVATFGQDLVDEVGGAMLVRQARRGSLHEWLEGRGLAGRLGGWLARAAPLRGRPLVTYHKTWVYFAQRFGLEVVAEIEEKPGIQPSARHRDRVEQLIEERGVATILQEVFYDRGAADYLARETGAGVLVVPIDIGPEVGLPTCTALIDHIVGRLLESEQRAAPPR